MSTRSFLPALLLLAACQSAAPRDVVDADPARRADLFSAVTALEGRWVGEGSDGMALEHEFKVTSQGSAVREVMFPGGEHEMTNMYSLDGNALAMTHYCAAGNQPRMRATAVEAGSLRFAFDGVSDLKADDELYMGEMTLKLVNENEIVEHWKAFKNGELEHEMVMTLRRVN